MIHFFGKKSERKNERTQTITYIIIFFQTSILACTLLKGTVPPFHPPVLGLMILCGIFGGLVESKLNRKLSNHIVEILFMAVMGIIICINVYNIFRYW